jgi:metallophosphoesterase (TIGR03767 family)
VSISRRGLLKVTGTGLVAVALDVGGEGGSADATTAAAVATSPLTTLDQTVVLTDPGEGGYRRLTTGPGEPHLVRADLAPTATATVRILTAFAQMTDLHIVDDQSPCRVEFLDRYSNDGPPHYGSYPTGAAYRPQESMSTHVVDAMCRAIAKAGHGPRTGYPLQFTIVTGDVVDNSQYNEVRWFVDLLDGGVIIPNSGHPTIDHSVTGDSLGLEIDYWHPQNRQFEIDNTRGPGLDLFFQAGYPEMLQLPYAARKPYAAYGVRMPWYSAFGNHDVLVQGNIPQDNLGVNFLLRNLRDLAVGNFKPSGIPGLPVRLDDVSDYFSLALAGLFGKPAGLIVPADNNRRLLSQSEFIQEHFSTTGYPVGHGFPNTSQTYYVIPRPPDEKVMHIVLDTTNPSGGANGRLTTTQYDWLEGQLRANSRRYLSADASGGTIVEQPQVEDKLIVIYSHHTLGTMDNSVGLDHGGYHGEQVRDLLLRYPNVILYVNGHNHKNQITSYRRHYLITGGFWEVTTASHIDWPYQSRIFEIAEGAGTTSIFTTMVDIDVPVDWRGLDINEPKTLASLSREAAANDLQQRTSGVLNRPGDLPDRNTQLLVPTPFILPIRLTGRATAAITAVTRATDRIDVFAVTPTGRTMTNWWNATTGWAGWYQVSGGFASTGGAGSPVTAVHRSAARVDAFTVGGDNRVWSTYWNSSIDWVAWYQIGTLACRPGSTATVVSRNVNQMDLFTIASDGRIMSIWWGAGGGWAADWFHVAGGYASPGSAVTGVARYSNHLDLFVVGTDNRVYSTYWDSASGWSSWFLLDGLTCRPGSTVTVVARDSEHLDLFTTGSDGRVMTTFWNSTGGWALRWWPLPGVSASPGSTVTAVSRSSDRLDLFVMATDNSVYGAYWDYATGWSSWYLNSRRGIAGGQVGIVCRLPDHMDLFAVGTEVNSPGQVHNIRWTAAAGWESAWTPIAAA